MNEKIIIDPSIAAIIAIGNIAEDEVVDIIFTADEDWADEYGFTVFNSEAKNTALPLNSAIIKEGMVMTLTIAPKLNAIAPGKHYYEIFNTTTERIEFKGELNIKK